MSKLKKQNEEQPEGLDLEEMVIAAFSRCQNFPKERAGVLGLAQGLRRAADQNRVAPARILQECATSSVFCPTDADLVAVARALRPEPSQGPRKCPEGLCDGSGWRQALSLHTQHGGEAEKAAWVEKQPTSREVYDAFWAQYDPNRRPLQMAYESRYRCKCHPAREDRIEKAGRYA